MTEQELKDKIMLFAYKLGDYQNACIQAGQCAAIGDIYKGRQYGQKINELQEDMMKWLGEQLVSK